MNDAHDAALKHAADVIAAAITVGTVGKMLPPIAAALTIIWTVLRIFEWFKDKKWK